MALDLIRAILVAILVLAVPGYLWANILVPSADRAERITFSVALSAVLVPTCGLLLAVLFGPGISLPISLTSVVLVTLGGLLAHYKLGQAEATDTCIHLDQTPLSALALLPLAAASVLMIGSMLGLLTVQSTWLVVALLIIASAVVHLAAQRQPLAPALLANGKHEKAASARPSRPFTSAIRSLSLRRLMLPLVLLLTLARSYVGPILHEWPYIRGQDQYAHSAMVNLVISRGSAEDILVYPPGFHVLSAMLVQISGLEPLRFYPLVAPALLLLPALACYVLANRLFGAPYGLAAAFFAGLVLNSSYLFVLDGTYVDLVAAQFLLVLSVVSIILLLFRPSIRHTVLVALTGSGVVLYHSVATIYLALLLLFVSVVFLPYLLWGRNHRRTGLVLFGALALLSLLSLLFAWDTYHVPQTLASLLGRTGTTDTANHAAMAIGTQQPRSAELVLAHISTAVVWFGLLGVLLLAPVLRGLRSINRLAVILLIAWVLLFFAASRTSLSGFPIRFTRDLGVPLSITAGFALVTILRSLDRRKPLGILAGALIVFSLLVQLQRGAARAVEPTVVLFMTPEIEEAGKWLRAHNEGGNIMVSPHRNQVPGNAMLAMGGYSELPSYTDRQLRQRRQIPPRDHQAVQDTLSVLKHPGSRRAREILERNDIRYVVVYKKLREGSYWYGVNRVSLRPFVRRTDLYEPVFQNSGVIIFKVRLDE
ncbi:MAG: DUF1616 domain-containing protein [Chloroflexota bacterium]|nr:DUF1616 domain-containing protein [Chloroflexota bacterium]